MPTFQNLAIERDGKLAVLTINRPKALNALDSDTLDELEFALTELGEDASVEAVIVTGAGEKAFIAGADISGMAQFGAAEGEAHARRGQRIVGMLESLPKVTIAAVNGYALGGGLEVALACDLRLASENAILGLPEVTLGTIPGFGGTQRLPRLIGAGRAKELLFTGRKVTALEAERIGLVNRVVTFDAKVEGADGRRPSSAREKLLDEAKALARDVLANGPVAVRLAKECVNRGMEVDLTTGLALEEKAFGLTFATADQKEGMKAFLEKRKPAFGGK